jgi:predicted Fe-S protein YdhL (DUF1289 family)
MPGNYYGTTLLAWPQSVLYTHNNLRLPTSMKTPKPSEKLTPTPQTPCVRNCCLDHREVCLGCGRLLAEILEWHNMDEARRLLVLAQAANRLAQA